MCWDAMAKAWMAGLGRQTLTSYFIYAGMLWLRSGWQGLFDLPGQFVWAAWFDKFVCRLSR